MTLVLMLLAAYLIGAIPTGIILTKLTGGEDLRKVGSGNIGATNVYRTAGRKLGVITLIGDCLKGIIPLLIALLLDIRGAELASIGLVALIGHCYPVYLSFKGGKGVATALGVFLVISPLSVLLVFVVFAGVLWKWRYISLASITSAAVIPYLIMLLEGSMMVFLVASGISVLVIWRHKENIERLMAGSENKFNL